MSHTVTINTRVRDPVAIREACRRLGLLLPEQGTVQLYNTQNAGLLLQLPGWRFPAVLDVASGNVAYDVYGGRWGAEAELHRFLQAYAVEVARIDARRQGRTVFEQKLPDGSILLDIIVEEGSIRS